ncbi:glycosyltransferase [Sphingomonas abietis]|uniref:Glycosyltransferase n=1 Tax=Sphingomonas abietis TaxID=3012344 RepID=A0ABY7NJ57_9SPHN|nr:glycosyltransferase [Sphingomonas abietis]WBO20850.1 glycosyltransferase [Sphingomonas abietis]
MLQWRAGNRDAFRRPTTLVIAVDLVLATRPKASTGIERYAVNLFKALRDISPETIAFVDRRSTVLDGPGVISIEGGFKGWALMPFASSYRAAKFDILLCPAFPPSPLALFSKTPVSRIIHDDFPWTRSATLNARGRFLFRDVETRMAPRYRPLFAPTDLMARSLAGILGRDVITIGNAPGLDLDAAPPVGERRPQLVAVGTIEPRKNYEAVLALTTHLPKSWSVAVVGRKGWGDVATDWDRRLDEKVGSLTWHGHASDADLLALYRTSSCFISMSLAEGFNMPLVEAGSLGLPIVCSDIVIHRTVAPPWAHFAPLTISPEHLSDIVLQASSALPAAADVAAYRQRFSWKAIAHKLERDIADD